MLPRAATAFALLAGAVLAACGAEPAAPTAASANVEETADFFSHERLYYVKVSSWDRNKTTPDALKEEQRTPGAKLAIYVVDPGSAEHCPDDGELLFESKAFALRTSGNMTNGTPKSSYKFKLEGDGGAAKFLGMKTLNLKSMWNDVSQMREALAWELFEKAEVPAPRHAYAKLCINDRYYGLYSVIEQVDKAMLQEAFGKKHDAGNLYKANWINEDLGPADLSYRSPGGDDDGSAYWKQHDLEHRTYELKTNEDDPEANTYDDLADLIRAVSGKTTPGTGVAQFDTPAFRAEVDRHLDAKAFLRWASVNVLLGAWDNYYGTPANYYLYNAGRGDEDAFMAEPRFTWIPWDYDNTLGIDFFGVDWAKTSLVDWSKHTRTEAKSLPLVTNLLANREYLAYYLDFTDCMLDAYFNETWVAAQIGDEDDHPGLWQLVRGAAFLESDSPTGAAHTGRRFTNDQVYWNGFRHHELKQGTQRTLGILHHVRIRHDNAKKQIADLRRTRNLPTASSPVCKAE